MGKMWKGVVEGEVEGLVLVEDAAAGEGASGWVAGRASEAQPK